MFVILSSQAHNPPKNNQTVFLYDVRHDFRKACGSFVGDARTKFCLFYRAGNKVADIFRRINAHASKAAHLLRDDSETEGGSIARWKRAKGTALLIM